MLFCGSHFSRQTLYAMTAFGAAVAAHLWCLDGLHGRELQKLDWLMCSTGQSQPKFIISNFVPSHTTIHCRKTITSSSSWYAKLSLPCRFTLCHCTWPEKYFVNHAGSLCVEQCLVDVRPILYMTLLWCLPSEACLIRNCSWYVWKHVCETLK